MDERQCIGLDMGTNTIRVGFCGNDIHSFEYANYTLDGQVIDYLSTPNVSHKFIPPTKNPESHDLKYGMESGNVLNEDVIQQILEHTFNQNEFQHDVHNNSFVVSHRPESAVNFSRDMSEMLFEQFEVNSLFFESQNTLELYAYGRGSGIVLNCGAGGTTCQIVIESTSGHRSTLTSALKGGRHMTELFVDKLKQSGRQAFSFLNHEHSNIYLVDTWRTSLLSSSNSTTLQLPDGTQVELDINNPRDKELLDFPSQLLFNEELVQSLVPSSEPVTFAEMFHQLHHSSVLDEWKFLSRNLLLSGKVCLNLDMKVLLENEVKKRIPYIGVQPAVHIAPDLPTLTFVGASILGSLSTFQRSLFPRQLYEETGMYYRRSFDC
jgi:actin-related protein